jgi:capsid protein
MLGKKKYVPYQPSKWEGRIDKALNLVAPQHVFKRMVSRERQNWFRYLAAQSNSARRNASPTTSGEIARGSREKMQVMWNAIEMVENSGLASGILQKFQTYVCGTLRWQARTGDKGVNDEHEAFFKERFSKPSLDLTGRFTGRQLAMLNVKGACLKGDMGNNVVRMDDDIYLQGIEANRIGDPYSYKSSDTYIRGLHIDQVGRIAAVDIYNQNRMSGRYYRSGPPLATRDENGLPKFLFFVNPISYDDYRGVSIFKTAIDNATYIESLRKYELQALLWAASQSGVFYTKSGQLPGDLPFDKGTPITDKSGNVLDTYMVRPNTVTALADGEDVKMFQHDRPSPNVMNMYRATQVDIATGTGLTFALVCDMTGFTGPAIRQMSGQDARAIGIWQELLRESFLDPVAMLLLGDGITKDEIQYHPNWLQGQWFFPPRVTIDVGRETTAGISEINAMLNSGAAYAAENSQDISEIAIQRGHETQEAIEIAQQIAGELKLDWREVYSLMKVGVSRGTALVDAAKAKLGGADQNTDQPGATSEGTQFDENDDGSNGSTPKNYRGRDTLVIEHVFSSDKKKRVLQAGSS